MEPQTEPTPEKEPAAESRSRGGADAGAETQSPTRTAPGRQASFRLSGLGDTRLRLTMIMATAGWSPTGLTVGGAAAERGQFSSTGRRRTEQ